MSEFVPGYVPTYDHSLKDIRKAIVYYKYSANSVSRLRKRDKYATEAVHKLI